MIVWMQIVIFWLDMIFTLMLLLTQTGVMVMFSLLTLLTLPLMMIMKRFTSLILIKMVM